MKDPAGSVRCPYLDLIMIRNSSFYCAAKPGYFWPNRSVEQVRVAVTIAAPEALCAGCSICAFHRRRPTMFLPFCIVRIPGLNHCHMRPQVVNMPVLCFVAALMPKYPGAHAARTKGTPDINVIARLQQDFAQSPDCHRTFARAMQDNCVGAGVGIQRTD